MKLDAPGLEVAGVRLDLLTEAHRAALADSGAVEAMWQWMPVIPTGTNFTAYFDHTLADARDGRSIPFAVTRLSDGAFAGVAAYLDISRTHRRLRIGYQWHPQSMRSGIVPAATALALITRARLCRIRRIEFQIDEENVAATKSVERLGATREGVLRSYMRAAKGTWANMAIYALVDNEIRTAMTLLQDRVEALQTA
ncbi:GNAT family protein [Hyphomonas sp.]|uniref:GNAT family N-acetyltransferase n=1 Tax=Hyphomonas sp. TaxID=87 RepID=UPI0025BACF7F|nr:GNAT family protein [Hyphomonas sp.]MBI1399862.1 GNAT family N-acetyltransferase [Hyphomonas sp.]